jgi:CHAT domain-containing protein
VSNYVGSGWPVNDEQATKLAKLFYQELLAGRAICDALRDARASITDYGSTWGAYQHYGNATDVVVRKKA